MRLGDFIHLIKIIQFLISPGLSEWCMPSCTAPVKADSQRYSVSSSSRQQLSSPASTSSSPPSDLSSRESSVWLSAMATSPLCWAGGDISLTSHHQTQPSGPRLRGRLSSEFKVQFFINYDNFTPSLSFPASSSRVQLQTLPRLPCSGLRRSWPRPGWRASW